MEEGNIVDLDTVERNCSVQRADSGLTMTKVRRISRRAALQRMTLGGGVMLLAACGQQAPAPGAPATAAPASKPADGKPADSTAAKPAESKPAAAATTAPAAAKPAGQPKSGGTLRVGQVGDIATLDATFTPGVAEIVWAV